MNFKALTIAIACDYGVDGGMACGLIIMNWLTQYVVTVKAPFVRQSWAHPCVNSIVEMLCAEVQQN